MEAGTLAGQDRGSPLLRGVIPRGPSTFWVTEPTGLGGGGLGDRPFPQAASFWLLCTEVIHVPRTDGEVCLREGQLEGAGLSRAGAVPPGDGGGGALEPGVKSALSHFLTQSRSHYLSGLISSSVKWETPAGRLGPGAEMGWKR